ncbi:hypothetical protein LPJ79_003610 [Coemansia sp. RSA 1821]|nr:hypothetical protein LPJ79_003610 [Coemansia sp. RSA 1821]
MALVAAALAAPTPQPEAGVHPERRQVVTIYPPYDRRDTNPQRRQVVTIYPPSRLTIYPPGRR